MHTRKNLDQLGVAFHVLICLLCFAGGAVSCVQAQDATYPPQKPSPPKIEPHVLALPEAVVLTQWPHTLDLVNAPSEMTVLNPGQCVRIGVYATGDGRDAFLKATKLSFRVSFAGHTDVHSFAEISQFKKLKPEGGDLVAEVLGTAGIQQPEAIKTMASLGVSSDRWCVPLDASDGVAKVEAEVAQGEAHTALPPSSIQVESFDTGSKKTFKDVEEFGTFLQTYYRHPNPARLIPALQFIVSDASFGKDGKAEIVCAFFSAALGAHPAAAGDFQKRILGEPPINRAVGLLILRAAGFDIANSLNALGEEERQKFLALSPLPDPFDLNPTQALFQHLDMMWAIFTANGEFKPVATIAGTLTWRPDYEEFDKMRNSPNHPTELTPSIVRAVVYTAAGWSLRSFQRNDPLVADYIDYLRASPDTAPAVKSELAVLQTNPAFKGTDGK